MNPAIRPNNFEREKDEEMNIEMEDAQTEEERE